MLKSPTSKNCEEVIEIGRIILNAADKYIFSTGSCTNVARANLILLYKTKCLEYLDSAKKSCKKALFLVEDDCTLLTLADIYRRNKKYEDAVATYLRCIASQECNGNSLTFIDESGSDIFSIASSSAINSMKLEAFKGLIQSYTQQT